jgi:hypothetical protein
MSKGERPRRALDEPPPSLLRALWANVLRGSPPSTAAPPSVDATTRASIEATESACAQASERVAEATRHAERQIALRARPTPPRDPPAGRFDRWSGEMKKQIAALRAPDGRPSRGPRGKRAEERVEALIHEAEERVAELARACVEASGHPRLWEQRAMLAVEAGDDDRAREALVRRAEATRTHRLLLSELWVEWSVLSAMKAALATISPVERDPKEG